MIQIEPGENGDVPYRLEAYTHGGSIVIKIPSTCDEFIGVLGLQTLKDADGPDRIQLFGQSEDGPYGEYGSVWNPDQQDGDD